LRADQAAAEEAARLEGHIAALQAELAGLKAQGAGQARDAQVSVLSSLFGLPEDRLRLVLILAVALVVELGSSLGLYLAARPRSEPALGPLPDADQQKGDTALPVGDIEDFVLSAIQLGQGQITNGQLYAAYQQWCTSNQSDAIGAVEFEKRFGELAKALPLVRVGGAFQGIAL
jgi:hypothetical protein